MDYNQNVRLQQLAAMSAQKQAYDTVSKQMLYQNELRNQMASDILRSSTTIDPRYIARQWHR